MVRAAMVFPKWQIIPPVKNFTISQYYHPYHKANDLVSLKTDILAVDDGVIISACWDGGYGNQIMIEHSNGFKTLYAHLSKFENDYKIGDEIKRGDRIGIMGSTGNSNGRHLHFEIRHNDIKLDPLPFLKL